MELYTVKTSLEIIMLCWIGYNGFRVLTSPRDAVKVGAEVQANCPHDFAFQSYLKVRDYYLLLSPAHKKYEISGTDLMKDVVIDVWESAGFQFVKHKYRVVEMVTNERMRLVSEKSKVKIFGLFKGESRSEVEFSFRPIPDGTSKLGVTIQIVFPNWLRHLMARLFFIEAIWQSHAHEEMNALARIVEQQFDAAA